MGTQTLPDQRPWLYAASVAAGLGLAGACARLRRREPAIRFAGHILAIERTTRLPVLRCLDMYGRPMLPVSQATPVFDPARALERS